MKAIKDKMSRSLPTSRSSSRTSSRSSSVNNLRLNETEGIDLLGMGLENEPDDINLHEFESSMPADTDHVPEYYRKFTESHPLGNLLLRMSAMNNELCRKLKVESVDQPDLKETCIRFMEAMKLEKDMINSRVSKATKGIENSILNKELNYHSVNASVQPPVYFSSEAVITTGRKLQDVLKTFPTKSTERFNGTAQGINVLEFLHAMNSAQAIMKLSKEEFLQILLKCVSGKVYTLVSECVNYGNDVGDVYHSLITLYDTRMTSADARKMLMNFRAMRNQSLMKVQSQVMEYASRVASDLPVGSSRTHMFNIEANNGLVRCLPHNSATIVSNVINSLCARLQRNPSYVEVIKTLHKYADTINQDIARNGVHVSKNSHGNGYSISSKSNFKVYSMEKRQARSDSTRGKHFRGNNNNREKSGAPTMRRHYTSNDSKRFHVNAMNTYHKNRDVRGQDRTYNMNSDRNGFKKGQKSTFKGTYCSLCGSRSHSAENICFKMKDENSRVIEVVPTFYPCEYCLKNVGKKLFHPINLCFNKREKERENKNQD